MPETSVWLYAGFLAFVAVMMALDLGVFHRKAHVVSLREAAIWSAIWVSLALLFAVGVWRFRGAEAGLAFLTGYVVEESLSVDNLFVFLVIFRYFALPKHLYHTALVWGILGAILTRGVMIGIGAALISRFHWILYVFGFILVVTAIKLFREGDDEQVDPGRNPLLRWARRIWPVTKTYQGGAFFVTRAGRTAATPLFLVVLVVESTDIVFAVDSIPAIFAITQDPFIVFTSNMFAVMGLRSIFFLLAGILHAFRYLKVGLALVLGFIGVKMLIEPWMPISIGWSLTVVALTLAGSIAASWIADRAAPSPSGRARRP
jgi:tellurite resistance protein TerC